MAMKKNNQENDYTFPNPPSDSISCLAANGTATTSTTMLIAGSWDCNLYAYELQYNQGAFSGSVRHNQLTHEAPVLACDVASDGMTTFSAGCDGHVRMWNATQPPTSSTIIGRHDQPIRNLKFMPEMNCVVTSSWDGTVRLWDCRSPQAAGILPHAERVYAMDAKGQFIVVGTADKQIYVYQGSTKVAELRSSLNYQTRCISIFEDTQGFAMGSIEGRISLEYFQELPIKKAAQNSGTAVKQQLRSFVFKFHRDGTDIYSVNSIDFNRRNTFVTGGSDGVMAIWDKEARQRLVIFEAHKKRCPITCVKFSPNASMLFYSLSYDWSRGAENNLPTMGNNIVIHPLAETEIAPKLSIGGGTGSRK